MTTARHCNPRRSRVTTILREAGVKSWRRRRATTIETHEVWVVSRTKMSSAVWCEECACQARMLMPEEAALMLHVSLRRIYALVEAGAIHFSERTDGGVLICLASLSAFIQQREAESV